MRILILSLLLFTGCGNKRPHETAVLFPSAISLGGDTLVISFGDDAKAYSYDFEELELHLDNGDYDLTVILLKDGQPISCFLAPVRLIGVSVEIDVVLTREACTNNYRGVEILVIDTPDPDLNNN